MDQSKVHDDDDDDDLVIVVFSLIDFFPAVISIVIYCIRQSYRMIRLSMYYNGAI